MQMHAVQYVDAAPSGMAEFVYEFVPCSTCGNDCTYILDGHSAQAMVTCSVCGERLSDDVRFLNHMMERHGFRNPSVDKPDRNSRGY